MSDEPKTRECSYYGDDLTIRHTFGEHENYGDTEFSFGPIHEFSGPRDERVKTLTDKFEIAAWRSIGRDRDNYDASHDASITLNADEVRELHILTGIWLEQQGG